MRAGRLDRRVDLQRATATQSPSGEPVETWSNIVTRRAASYAPVRGEERFSAPQFNAKEQVEFRVRWSRALAGLNPKDRLIYPALVDGLSPPDEITPDRVFDIMAVHEIGRREGLRIMTVRRADV